MTYEYLCESCGHAWEAEQRISEAPLKLCPACGNESAKRQVSLGAGFILKGGGWYSDLYSSSKGGGGSSGGESSGSSGSSSSGSSGSSDSSSSNSGSSGSSGGSSGSPSSSTS